MKEKERGPFPSEFQGQILRMQRFHDKLNGYATDPAALAAATADYKKKLKLMQSVQGPAAGALRLMHDSS